MSLISLQSVKVIPFFGGKKPVSTPKSLHLSQKVKKQGFPSCKSPFYHSPGPSRLDATEAALCLLSSRLLLLSLPSSSCTAPQGHISDLCPLFTGALYLSLYHHIIKELILFSSESPKFTCKIHPLPVTGRGRSI